MGHLVPAGTGIKKYRTLMVESPEDEEAEAQIITEMEEIDEQVEITMDAEAKDVTGTVSEEDMAPVPEAESEEEGAVVTDVKETVSDGDVTSEEKDLS